MNIYHLSFGFLLNLLVFSLIGMGPALFLLAPKQRVTFALAISPVLGFALTSICGTYFVLLDIPVSRWSVPWLIIGIVISVVLSLLRFGTGSIQWDQQGRRVTSYGLAGFIVTSVLVIAPQLAGGLQFSVLRGNGTDSFAYVAVAGYLDQEPYSWASKADIQTRVDRHPSYERVRQLLNARWTTSMMLAFSSRVAQIPIYMFEYLSSVLWLLLAFGPAYIYAVYLRVRPELAALLVITICTGFWAQIVTDMRPVSQMNSIPILLVLALLVVRIECGETSDKWYGEYALIGVFGLAMVFVYPEIVPMVALAGVIFFAARASQRHYAHRRLLSYSLALIGAVLGTVPLAQLLISFIRVQLSSASSAPNNWHLAYFGWLYSNPLQGFWGLSPLPVFLHWLALFLGLVLSAVLAVSILRLASVRKSDEAMGMCLAICLSGAALIEFIYLYSRRQFWAAGKALSFCYPFFMLVTAGAALANLPRLGRNWQVLVRRLVSTCVLTWIIFQCALGAYRVRIAASGNEYPNYISHHGDYRRHDWDLTKFAKRASNQKGTTVWSYISYPFVSDYIGFLVGWEVNLASLGVTHDSVEFGVPKPRLLQPPQYVILENSPFGLAQNASLVAKTSELSIFKTTGSTPLIAGIVNPNGLEDTNKQLFFWLGGQPTVLTVISPFNGFAVFRARFMLGPSLPERDSRTLVVNSSAGSSPQRIVIVGGVQQLRVPLTMGVNTITAAVAEKPTAYLLTDKRPLMLRVDDLRLEQWTCSDIGEHN